MIQYHICEWQMCKYKLPSVPSKQLKVSFTLADVHEFSSTSKQFNWDLRIIGFQLHFEHYFES